MKTPENIKIKRRLVGLKRLPTLIEINNYKCPVPMYYVFRLDLVSTNKSKVTYPKGTLSASHKITLEYVRAGNIAITYKLLADDEFCAFVNLEYLGMAQLGYRALGIDDTYSGVIKDALSIVYSILVKDYSSEKELVSLCERLNKYFTPTLYSKLRSEKLQW